MPRDWTSWQRNRIMIYDWREAEIRFVRMRWSVSLKQEVSLNVKVSVAHNII